MLEVLASSLAPATSDLITAFLQYLREAVRENVSLNHPSITAFTASSFASPQDAAELMGVDYRDPHGHAGYLLSIPPDYSWAESHFISPLFGEILQQESTCC